MTILCNEDATIINRADRLATVILCGGDFNRMEERWGSPSMLLDSGADLADHHGYATTCERIEKAYNILTGNN